MKYDYVVLRDLIDIYERRNANSSSFKTRVKIKINKQKYPKYFEDPDGYNETIERLKSKSYIDVHKMPYDTVIDSISLNIKKVDEIIEVLGLNSVSGKRDRLLTELSKYNDPLIVDFKLRIEERIKQNKTIKQYLNDDFIDAVKIVHYLENLENDIYERNASNYLFNDSKRLAKIKNIISNFYDNENIFEEKGIIQVPPLMYLKGNGIITINNQTIELSKVKKFIGIPVDDINVLEFKGINKVTTIENLTTFHNYSSEGLIVYLGGFSTRSQIKVLKKIKETCVNFYHFGDIDLGGFTILNNLMETLNIKIQGVNMDLDTLKLNLKYAQSIDDIKYIDKLKMLLNKPLLEDYYETIYYLINNHIRLEQESFYNL